MQRVLHALATFEKHLVSRSLDYSAWDDTYEYALKPNKEYEKHNLFNQMFFTNEFNVLVILNNQQEILFKKAVRLEEEREAVVSKSLLKKLATDPILSHALKQGSFSGIIQLREGPMLIISQPILKSDLTGPRAGTMIVGHYLDDQVINELQDNTLLPVELVDLKRTAIPKEVKSNKPRSIQLTTVWLDANKTDEYSAYAALPDLHGNPAAILHITDDRHLYNKGRKSVFYLLILIIVAALLLLKGALSFVDRLVFRRLNRLMKNMIAIQQSNDLSARIHVRGKDEIALLEHEFNTMMDSLDTFRRHITKLAYKDSLTHLPNRTFFYNEVSTLLEKLKKMARMGAVLFIDLDGFKQVNDSYGHDHGDLLLQKTAERIKGVTREQDIVSRLGGDEFIIFLFDLKNEEEAVCIADRICQTVVQPVDLNGAKAKVSASVGISSFPRDGQHPDELIKKADQAMYEAKRKGKNQLHVFNEKTAINEKPRPL
ncbi:MAG TPA: diguanylate cyclase [Pseudobacillus sp.]